MPYLCYKTRVMYNFARNTRIALSAGFGVVAFFAASMATTGIAVNAGWICRLQIMGLIVSGAIPMLAAWGVATYLFGRVYCSSVCPLGTVMDAVSHAGQRTGGRARGYHYRKPSTRTQAVFLIIAGSGLVAGNALITCVLDPFFDFNRMIEGAVIPACTLGAAGVGALTAVEGVVIFAVVAGVSWRNGRLLCNTVCPVGGALGLISRHSLMRMDINTDLCTGCLRCVEVCKSECIDPMSHTIDTSRCVMCMNCAAACPNKAITYTSSRHRLQKPLMA